MSRSRRRSRAWRPGTQHAPRFRTIGISSLLVLVGVLFTFGLPAIVDTLRVSAGVADTLEWVGVAAYALATILMLLGIFLEGL